MPAHRLHLMKLKTLEYSQGHKHTETRSSLLCNANCNPLSIPPGQTDQRQ